MSGACRQESNTGEHASVTEDNAWCFALWLLWRSWLGLGVQEILASVLNWLQSPAISKEEGDAPVTRADFVFHTCSDTE